MKNSCQLSVASCQLKFLLIILVIAFLFPSAAIAKKKPDWIEGSSKKYAEPQFFIGVGSVQMDKGGKKQQMDRAADMARAEVAKTLRTHVQTTTYSERTVKIDASSKKPSSRGTQSEVVTASADELLEGVEIKEYYKDKKDNMVYALAILDRPMAARRVQNRIDKIKQEMLSEMEAGKNFQSEKNPLLSIRHYNKALRLAEGVNKESELLAVLSPAGISQLETTTNYVADIKTILHGLAKMVRFNVDVQGPAEGARTYIIQGLANGGFITGGEGATRSYFLKGKTDLTYKGEMKMGDKLTVQVYQADLDLEIMDPTTKESIGAITWSVSANEKTPDMASKSAVRALGRTVEKEIAEKVLNSF